MPRRLLPLTALIVGLLAPPGWAADDVPPPAPAAVEPPPANRAASPLQTGSVAQPAEMDFSREFADRLAITGGNLSAADREDRAALAEFYAGRQQAPRMGRRERPYGGGRGRRRRDPPCR